MAETTRKTTTQRSWALTPIDAGTTPMVWATHEIIVKDVWLPSEATTHDWTLDIRFPRAGRDSDDRKVVIGKAGDQASFDALLNVVRQAMVDARAWTQAGGP